MHHELARKKNTHNQWLSIIIRTYLSNDGPYYLKTKRKYEVVVKPYLQLKDRKIHPSEGNDIISSKYSNENINGRSV